MQNANLIPTDAPGYYRNTDTGVVINKNISELERYTAEIKRAQDQDQLNTKVECLHAEIQLLKQFIKNFAEK